MLRKELNIIFTSLLSKILTHVSLFNLGQLKCTYQSSLCFYVYHFVFCNRYHLF